jgi:two-component system OmpR family response regulator
MARIMIIDDDVEIAGNLALMLTALGHAVETLDSTEGAEASLTANPPEVLVLDVMFPSNPAAGFDLARRIRRNKKIARLPILLLTAINQEFPADFSARDIDSEWMPVDDFVEKPFDVRTLNRKIEAILARTPAH